MLLIDSEFYSTKAEPFLLDRAMMILSDEARRGQNNTMCALTEYYEVVMLLS